MVFRVPRFDFDQGTDKDATMTRRRDIFSGARATLRRGEPCDLFHAREHADFVQRPIGCIGDDVVARCQRAARPAAATCLRTAV